MDIKPKACFDCEVVYDQDSLWPHTIIEICEKGCREEYDRFFCKKCKNKYGRFSILIQKHINKSAPWYDHFTKKKIKVKYKKFDAYKYEI